MPFGLVVVFLLFFALIWIWKKLPIWGKLVAIFAPWVLVTVAGSIRHSMNQEKSAAPATLSREAPAKPPLVFGWTGTQKEPSAAKLKHRSPQQ